MGESKEDIVASGSVKGGVNDGWKKTTSIYVSA